MHQSRVVERRTSCIEIANFLTKLFSFRIDVFINFVLFLFFINLNWMFDL